MFDHVGIRGADRARSRDFYDTVLAPLGRSITHGGESYDEWNDFSTAQAEDDRPVTRGLHVGFGTRSPADVDAFWLAGTTAGCRSDGEPGPRPQYHADYYGG